MCCGTDKPDAMMGALDFSLNSKIADAVASFQRVHGAKAKGILSRMGEIQERRFEYVGEYVNKRLSGLSHADAL